MIVVGALLVLPSLGLLAGGAALTAGYATERDDDGYFDATLERLSASTAAITTGEVDLSADPGPPDRVLDLVDFSVRIRATAVDQGAELFIGIGPEADVESYLRGVARDEIRDVDSDGDPEYRRIPGTEIPAPPAEQGGFKWSSQHLEVRSRDGKATGVGDEGNRKAADAVSRPSTGCAS